MTENDDYTEARRPSDKTDRSVEHIEASAHRGTAISDIDLQALVDGALDPEHEKTVRALMENDSAARGRYRELLEQKRLLIAWWRQFS